MISYTDEELSTFSEANRDKASPFVIKNVSSSQLSIARHYGAIKFNSHTYKYMPETDELIRDDCLRFLQKIRKKKPEKLISTNLEMF